jgi:sugar phosphate permease
MSTITSKISKLDYGWYILFLGMLSYAIVGGAERMCVPVLFKDISTELNLSLVAVGVIWGMDPLPGVFFSLPAGLLADRFGVKRTLAVVCLLGGLLCGLRGLSDSFTTLAIWMFLFGIMGSALPSIVPKATIVWFPGRRLGLANAALVVAAAAGMMVSTMLSATVFAPWLGSWRYVLYLFGVPGLIVGFLWAFTGREPKKGESVNTAVNEIPFRQALSQVVRTKEVWLIGLSEMCLAGMNAGVNGYLSLYLRNIGWAPVNADGAMTLLNGIGIIGSIPVVILAERFRVGKGALIVTLSVIAVCVGLLPLVNVPLVWTLIGINGLVRGAAWAFYYLILFNVKSIGSTYAGTAIGLTGTFAMLGAFFSPPLGNSAAEIDPGYAFFVWGAIGILSVPGIFFIRSHRQRVT